MQDNTENTIPHDDIHQERSKLKVGRTPFGGTQLIPGWFEGDIYDEGAIVTDHEGQPHHLTGVELSLFDFILGASMTIEVYEDDDSDSEQSAESIDYLAEVRDRALDWFKANNPVFHYKYFAF